MSALFIAQRVGSAGIFGLLFGGGTADTSGNATGGDGPAGGGMGGSSDSSGNANGSDGSGSGGMTGGVSPGNSGSAVGDEGGASGGMGGGGSSGTSGNSTGTDGVAGGGMAGASPDLTDALIALITGRAYSRWRALPPVGPAMGEIGPIESGELKMCWFDFTDEAGYGAVLSNPTVVPALLDGVDPDFANIASGSPFVYGTVVLQLLQPGVPGCTYVLRAYVTDDAGQRHSIGTKLRAVPA